MIINAELVENAKRGDPVAFTKLYNLTYKSAYGVCSQLVKNADDAGDILQDSYIMAFTKLNTLEDNDKFQGWFNRIVANNCKNFLKKKKPTLFSEISSIDEDGETLEPEFEDVSGDFSPDKNLDYEETKAVLQEVIDLLPEEQRMCVLMHYVQEMSVMEIADILNVSQNTVKSRLNYGRKKMRTELEDRKKKGVVICGLSGLAIIPFLRWMFSEGMFINAPNVLPQTLATVNKAAMANPKTSVVSESLTQTKKSATVSKKSWTSGIVVKAGAVVAATAIAGAGVTVIADSSVNVEKYFEDVVYCEGYNGYGVFNDLDSIIDIEELEKQLCGNETNLEKYNLYCSLNNRDIMDYIDITIGSGENDNLSNGDEILVQVKIDYEKINAIDGVEKDLKGDELYSVVCKVDGLTAGNYINIFSIIKSIDIDTSNELSPLKIEYINNDNRVDFGHCVVTWQNQSNNQILCGISYQSSVTGAYKTEYIFINFSIPSDKEFITENEITASLDMASDRFVDAGFVFTTMEQGFQINRVFSLFGKNFSDNINDESYEIMKDKVMKKAESRFGENISHIRSLILRVDGYSPCVAVFIHNDVNGKYFMYEYKNFLIDQNYSVYEPENLEPTLYEVWQTDANEKYVNPT